jgi:hypothetical protein
MVKLSKSLIKEFIKGPVIQVMQGLFDFKLKVIGQQL